MRFSVRTVVYPARKPGAVSKHTYVLLWYTDNLVQLFRVCFLEGRGREGAKGRKAGVSYHGRIHVLCLCIKQQLGTTHNLRTCSYLPLDL